jgi:hypothetical protein
MFLAFLEDVEAFTEELGGQATFTRPAVTPEQIRDFGLPTARVHGSAGPSMARRARPKLSPDDLANILRTAIEARIDRRALAHVRRREGVARRELVNRLGED